jgi:hypothetical protein
VTVHSIACQGLLLKPRNLMQYHNDIVLWDFLGVMALELDKQLGSLNEETLTELEPSASLQEIQSSALCTLCVKNTTVYINLHADNLTISRRMVNCADKAVDFEFSDPLFSIEAMIFAIDHLKSLDDKEEK